MGMKPRPVSRQRKIAQELQELLDEVLDVISDENEEAAIRLTGYLDQLQGRPLRGEAIDSGLQGAYQEGVDAAIAIRG